MSNILFDQLVFPFILRFFFVSGLISLAVGFGPDITAEPAALTGSNDRRALDLQLRGASRTVRGLCLETALQARHGERAGSAHPGEMATAAMEHGQRIRLLNAIVEQTIVGGL